VKGKKKEQEKIKRLFRSLIARGKKRKSLQKKKR
jgi:hypothetical protein